MSSPPPLPKLSHRWWQRQTGQTGWALLRQSLHEKELDSSIQIELENFRPITVQGAMLEALSTYVPQLMLISIGVGVYSGKQHFLSGMETPVYAPSTVILIWNPAVNWAFLPKTW